MIASGLVRHAWPVIVLLTMLTCAPSAWAQQPSANAIASAKEILEIKGAPGLYQNVVPNIVEQAKNLFLQTNPMLSKDLNEVAVQVRKDFIPRQQDIADQIAKAYASRFTEQELKDIVIFYKTPLGRKMIAEEPQLVDQTMATIRNWADKLSQEIIGQFRAEMKKKGHDI